MIEIPWGVAGGNSSLASSSDRCTITYGFAKLAYNDCETIGKVLMTTTEARNFGQKCQKRLKTTRNCLPQPGHAEANWNFERRRAHQQQTHQHPQQQYRPVPRDALPPTSPIVPKSAIGPSAHYHTATIISSERQWFFASFSHHHHHQKQNHQIGVHK